MNFWLPAIGGSGGTDGIYKLAGNLVQKLPTSKEVQASKIDSAYLQNNRKFSNMSKCSKGKKDNKSQSSNYNTSKENIVKAYKNSATHHGNYTTEPLKYHKRSSSDSQKLYDLNKWTSFNPPMAKQK